MRLKPEVPGADPGLLSAQDYAAFAEG